MEEFSTPLLVVAVALIGDSGAILLQKRHFSSVHGGLWEFPGGKVESGETAEQAALREIDEELGLTLTLDSLDPVGFASGTNAGGSAARPIVILLYACRSWSGEPVSRDAAAIGWFAIDEIEALSMPPLDYPLARQLRDKHFKY